jgi:hypothetical protein
MGGGLPESRSVRTCCPVLQSRDWTNQIGSRSQQDFVFSSKIGQWAPKEALRALASNRRLQDGAGRKLQMSSWKIGALLLAAMSLVIVSGCKGSEEATDTTGTTATTAGATTGGTTTSGTAGTTAGATTTGGAMGSTAGTTAGAPTTTTGTTAGAPPTTTTGK